MFRPKSWAGSAGLFLFLWKIAVPASLSGINPYYFLVVSKETQTLQCYRFDGAGFKVERSFPCTTGKNHGTKEKPGDSRTPDGTYRILEKIPGERLPAKYGVAAYTLDFPDVLDRRLHRSGSGIWLHGTPIERPPYNSEGCVVLNDSHLEQVMEYVKPGQTFVHISYEPLHFTHSFVREIYDTLDQWKKSWESMQPDKYLAYYDEQFIGGGKDRQAWAAYKKQVNRNKRYIQVSISDLQIIPYGSTDLGEIALAFFRQEYRSSNLNSKTNKVLYLAKRNGAWKIIAEEVL